MAGGVEKIAEKPLKPVQRLCNEIQLFDLCDLENCRHKVGLYCTDEELLNRFEAIAEEEQRPAEGNLSDEIDEEDGADGEEFDAAVDDDEFGDERDEEEE